MLQKQKVALLTAGGLAPCLSSAVGGLIERYTEISPEVEIIAYKNGYKGLLLGESFVIDAETRKNAGHLHKFGGSPIGNSRVKLTNVKDCLKRGLVKDGEDPLKIAAEQLKKDGVTILHTIGGDDTNTTAADLAKFLKTNSYNLTVVGLPKTIDNDVIPIRQSLGAWTAAEQGALFFENVVNEQNSNPRTLVVHEVMGRNCGWLTAATALAYRNVLKTKTFLPGANLTFEQLDIDAIYVPELTIDLVAEGKRLKKIMDEKDSVNIFLSEGAGVNEVVAELEAKGQEVGRDAFGHIKLDTINPGKYFANQFAEALNADKTLVQKSGYFARSAAANPEDLRLIKSCTDLAVEAGLRGQSGVIGHDEEQQGILRPIEFERIKGGKPFDTDTVWFKQMLEEIQQPIGEKNHPQTH